MAAVNTQFSIAVHILAGLGFGWKYGPIRLNLNSVWSDEKDRGPTSAVSVNNGNGAYSVVQEQPFDDYLEVNLSGSFTLIPKTRDNWLGLEVYFSANNLDGMLFPTTIAPAPPIDTAKGSGEMTINGGKPVPTFDTIIRNTDPGSNAGLPGLSLFAGMTPGGLPVGLEIDGPVGSDGKLLGLGLAIEALLGDAPPPKV